MADPSAFKLFRSVDPSTVNVPIKEKFAKLTLSSNKKKTQSENQQERSQQQRRSGSGSTNVSRQLLKDLNKIDTKDIVGKTYEHPLLRSDSSSPVTMGFEDTPKPLPLDDSECMDALQLSSDGCTQLTDTNTDVDVEGLSTQVSNLTMQENAKPMTKLQPEISICISSTTEEELNDTSNDNDDSCITISDSSSEPDLGPESMAVSDQQKSSMTPDVVLPPPLPSDKEERMRAFLRDVSFERHQLKSRGVTDLSASNLHSRIASADTESMSLNMECTQLTPSKEQLDDSSKRLAANETEVNSLCTEEHMVMTKLELSKRLADDDTEVNTICSESSKRLAGDDTELNTPDVEEDAEASVHNSTLNGDQEAEESLVVPETCSETEQSPVRQASPSVDSDVEQLATPTIQVSSINISATINIKIHIPTMSSSSSGESEHEAESGAVAPPIVLDSSPELSSKTKQAQLPAQRSMLLEDASEDEEFLANAEQLLNQLYGKSWQTPDVIRTLKHSSGSKKAVASRTPIDSETRRPPRLRRAAVTTIKKRPLAPTMAPNESALGDFSIFKRTLHSSGKMNSTQMVTPANRLKENKKPSATTGGGSSRPRVRTNHVDEERWRALVDTDSGTDASDDEDANATDSDSSESGSGDQEAPQEVTYLDLTRAEVQVSSSPDEENQRKVDQFPKKLSDILSSCRAVEKPKIAGVTTPVSKADVIPTRRQLFTPNIGFETDAEARLIVSQAEDLYDLEQLASTYLPGTAVYRLVQEELKKLKTKTAIHKPVVFKEPTVTPKPTPKTKKGALPYETPTSQRKPLVASKRINAKYGFIKSLGELISQENCDPEAYAYRMNFAKKKEELADRLLKLYNEKVFNNKLDVPIVWSKLLRNTAGRCKNKTRFNQRLSVVELSLKVLTTAERLRCTLIHELCHAAAWIFDKAGGHGQVWKSWAKRANDAFPDLPRITVHHDYNIEFKYTYKCNNCQVSMHAHSRTRKAENLRCNVCRGPIVLLLNKKDKNGAVVATPAREATGFAKYVKDNFQKYKRENRTAAEVMRILGAEYAKEKTKGGQQTTPSSSHSSLTKQVEAITLD